MKKPDWRVKTRRPEELLKQPAAYYTAQEAERYSRSAAMRRAQEQLTLRAIQLLRLPANSKLLDAGCGTGFSTLTARKVGYKTSAFDASPEMVAQARKHGVSAKLADMRKIPFPSSSFDGVISITALQWLLSEAPEANTAKAAAELYRVLKPGCRGVAHFYPRSLADAKIVLRAFQRFFDAKLVIENPESARKRRVFLVFEKVRA